MPDLVPPKFNPLAIASSPFRYAIVETCLSSQTCDRILHWFENGAPWRLSRTDFYEQFEFSCWDSDSPVALFLMSNVVLERVRSMMTNVFDRTFDEDVSVVCHQLVAPQKIGIHNDFLEAQETHRLVIQLNRGLSDADGGVLMLFNSENPEDVHRLLRPVHLSAFAFEISPASNHAVSQVYGGERYTLIYSLRERSS